MTVPNRNNFYPTPKASEYEEALKGVPDKANVVFLRYKINTLLGKGAIGSVFIVVLDPQGVMKQNVKEDPGKLKLVIAEAEKEIETMSMLRAGFSKEFYTFVLPRQKSRSSNCRTIMYGSRISITSTLQHPRWTEPDPSASSPPTS